ncbi:MFS transporter [Bacteroides sp.]
MSNKLWTIHFMRICIANLLLFISLYMLFPVVPVEMADRLGAPVSQTGAMFLLLTLGMFAVGPFHAYLVDAYKRKYVCAFSFAAMIAATAGYAFVSDITQLLLLCFVQGIAFGMATTAGITLAIDITNSNLRSSGNVSFSWAARMGMLIGIALGVGLYQWYDFKILLYVSVIVGLVGIFFVSRVYVPFRAPIVTKLCSSDRFFLPRGWLPALNFILIAFIPGLLLPVFHHSLSDVSISGFEIPFFAIVGVGFLLSVLLARLVYREEKTLRVIILGTSLMMVSLILLEEMPTVVTAILLGLGLGLITPEFLLIFVKLSQHCQRGTANTTHLLAWETGMSLGLAVACYLSVEYSVVSIYHLGRILAPITLLFFVLLTYPYYKKKRVR